MADISSNGMMLQNPQDDSAYQAAVNDLIRIALELKNGLTTSAWTGGIAANAVNATHLLATPISATAPADGQVLAYNATDGEYEPTSPATATSTTTQVQTNTYAPFYGFCFCGQTNIVTSTISPVIFVPTFSTVGGAFSSGKFTCATAGYFLVSVSCSIVYPLTNVLLSIIKSGSAFGTAGAGLGAGPLTGDGYSASVTAILQCAVGDTVYFDIQTGTTGGGGLNIFNASLFQVG
jgi:hypothetical protein